MNRRWLVKILPQVSRCCCLRDPEETARRSSSHIRVKWQSLSGSPRRYPSAAVGGAWGAFTSQ